jgi:hypothetical protein
MAAKSKGKTKPWVWIVLLAAAGGGGYLYYQQQQKKKAAAAAAAGTSSSQAQGVTPLPMDLPSPMEYPNSMSGTPTIQNFVSSTEPVVSSTQTTIIQPIISGFHHKPRFIQPHHRPTSPMAPHRSGWITP